MKTLENLFKVMLKTLKNDLLQLDHKSLLEELIRREKDYSSLIGHGISLPHTYTDSIEESILTVARLNKPVKCRHSGAEILFVFMVLSPAGRPEEHLGLISKIAKFVMREETRRALQKATSADGLYQVIERG